MTNATQRGFQYFESETMKDLYDQMTAWREKNKFEKFDSMTIQQDKKKFCCIAITAPTDPVEVVIRAGNCERYAQVKNGFLMVRQSIYHG